MATSSVCGSPSSSKLSCARSIRATDCAGRSFQRSNRSLTSRCLLAFQSFASFDSYFKARRNLPTRVIQVIRAIVRAHHGSAPDEVARIMKRRQLWNRLHCHCQIQVVVLRPCISREQQAHNANDKTHLPGTDVLCKTINIERLTSESSLSLGRRACQTICLGRYDEHSTPEGID